MNITMFIEYLLRLYHEYLIQEFIHIFYLTTIYMGQSCRKSSLVMQTLKGHISDMVLSSHK